MERGGKGRGWAEVEDLHFKQTAKKKKERRESQYHWRERDSGERSHSYHVFISLLSSLSVQPLREGEEKGVGREREKERETEREGEEEEKKERTGEIYQIQTSDLFFPMLSNCTTKLR